MNEKFQIGHLYPGKIPPAIQRRPAGQTPLEPGQRSFQDVLNDQLIKFSHHAEMRLQQRGIHLGEEQMAKIQNAVDKAAAKGARESLILIQDLALIVNIKNRTVVTAMDGSSMKDNVFTQIDSAVVVS
jgi:flagellar operon protein